jgi:pimeloyl-ACP methyl ester carboxylesterase
VRTEELERDGIRLLVFSTGLDDGWPVVLFVNAVGMPAELLAGLAADFHRTGFRFVTWELRGSPGPSLGRRDCAVSTHAEDGMAIVAALGLRRVHLAGWCTGASVALFLAESLGERAESLTSIDGAYLFEGVPGAPLGDAMFAMCRDIVADERLGAHYHKLTRPRGQEAAVLGLEGRPQLVEQVTLPYRQGVDELVRYAFAIDAACDYDPAAMWAKVRRPVLFTARRDDRMASYRNSARSSELAPGARLALAESGGHYGLFTDDGAVRTISTFMSSVDRS